MPHDHDEGLAHDLRIMHGRRQILRWLAAAPLLSMAGCAGASGSTGTTGSTGNGNDGGTNGSCSVINEETAGPYPGDGSNGPNALALSGIVRSDIRSSIGTATGVAAGVPMTVNLTLVNTKSACEPLAGYALYLWHCDQSGNYSMYSSAVVNENYLRGVQETDDSGVATFTTVFPGCYSGRMPHMHFEVYPSLASAGTYASKVKTSQIAFPATACNAVYASSGYEASVSNYASISFATDNVFSDGVTLELASVSGSVAAGYVANLTVGISV